MEDLWKDPEKMKKLQEEAVKIMGDPAKKKQLEDWSSKMANAVKELEKDAEMKQFVEDVKANGFEALKKNKNYGRILSKFSTAGMPVIPEWLQRPGAGAESMATRDFQPGDEVVISGLTKSPEINGKKAMVVPPTEEEKQTLEGTNRLIVRLMESGKQCAVKPDNLRISSQAADSFLNQTLEDLSVDNPAVQREAAKLQDSGKLDELQNDPELRPIFEDIQKNGMSALEKYWGDAKVMDKINKALSTDSER